MDKSTRELLEASEGLLHAIEKRWAGESERKRENAISPRQEEAMDRLRAAIDNHPK